MNLAKAKFKVLSVPYRFYDDFEQRLKEQLVEYEDELKMQAIDFSVSRDVASDREEGWRIATVVVAFMPL